MINIDKLWDGTGIHGVLLHFGQIHVHSYPLEQLNIVQFDIWIIPLEVSFSLVKSTCWLFTLL
jgi:hypothetical protein